MVEIRKGKTVTSVSLSAYNNYFKDSGWELVGGDEKLPTTTPDVPEVEEVKNDVEENVDSDDVSDEDWDEALEEDEELKDNDIEKPLSEMNKEELLAKASSLGLNVSENSTNKQIREAIKSFR